MTEFSRPIFDLGTLHQPIQDTCLAAAPEPGRSNGTDRSTTDMLWSNPAETHDGIPDNHRPDQSH